MKKALTQAGLFLAIASAVALAPLTRSFTPSTASGLTLETSASYESITSSPLG